MNVLKELVVGNLRIVVAQIEEEAPAPPATVTAAPAAQSESPKRRKRRDAGKVRPKAGESAESVAKRQAALNAKKAQPAPAPAAPADPLAAVEAAPTAPAADALTAADNGKAERQTVFVPICEAAALVDYEGPSGKKTYAIWKYGTNNRGHWYRLRFLSEKRPGYCEGTGFFASPKKLVKGTLVRDPAELKKRCGCPACR